MGGRKGLTKKKALCGDLAEAMETRTTLDVVVNGVACKLTVWQYSIKLSGRHELSADCVLTVK